MPNLSASDYTTYLKLKAAAASPIAPAIQTRTNATLSQSVLNANIFASQAAFVMTPRLTTITGANYVRARPPNQVNNPRAFSTLATGTLSSSRVQQPGGLPVGFRGSQGTYHRIPQTAGWGT